MHCLHRLLFTSKAIGLQTGKWLSLKSDLTPYSVLFVSYAIGIFLEKKNIQDEMSCYKNQFWGQKTGNCNFVHYLDSE